MKNLSLTVSLIFSLLTSCVCAGNKVDGSENVVVKTTEVEAFIKLSIDCGCDVELIQSDETKVVIEADDNLHEHFDIANDGEWLRVKTKDKVGFKSYKKCKVTVYMTTIDEINSNCVGKVFTSTPIVSNNFILNISSVGSTSFQLNVKSLNLKNKSVGNLTVSGSAEIAKIKNSSVGNVNMKEFFVKILDVQNSSVGNIHVYASDELSIDNSGVGKMTYSGDAKIISLENSSVGKLKKE